MTRRDLFAAVPALGVAALVAAPTEPPLPGFVLVPISRFVYARFKSRIDKECLFHPYLLQHDSAVIYLPMRAENVQKHWRDLRGLA